MEIKNYILIFSTILFLYFSYLNIAKQNLFIEVCRAKKNDSIFNGYLVNWRTFL